MSEMNELIDEIKEDVRLDQLINFWKKYSNFIIGGLLAIIIATIGHVVWGHLKHQKNQKYAATYEQALRTADKGEFDKVKEILNSFPNEHDGYKVLASFKKSHLQNTSQEERFKIYLEIAENKKIEAKFRELSIILLGYEGLETQDPDTLVKHLELIAKGESVWRDSAMELLGLLAIRQNDLKKASTLLKNLHTDKQALASIRSRAMVYLEQIGALN